MTGGAGGDRIRDGLRMPVMAYDARSGFRTPAGFGRRRWWLVDAQYGMRVPLLLAGVRGGWRTPVVMASAPGALFAGGGYWVVR